VTKNLKKNVIIVFFFLSEKMNSIYCITNSKINYYNSNITSYNLLIVIGW